MDLLEKIKFLNNILLNEMPQYKTQAKSFDNTFENQRSLLRALMNVRSPMPLDAEFLAVQDEVLQQELSKKSIVTLDDLSPCNKNQQIYLWQGDITLLKVDAIVNAANSAMLGCFIPHHKCIDNAIHSAAGLQLRDECNKIMIAQGHDELTADAKITLSYNLPSKYVIHTVGPIIGNKLTDKDCDLLENAYRSCMKLAIKNNLKSIAFCCISTGEFHFPNDVASQIAIQTIETILKNTNYEIKVIFNVFKDLDKKLYEELLG